MFGRRFQTRPPPPSGQPPPYAFSRYVSYNLRPVVIAVGVAAAVYSILWGASAFSSIHPDKTQSLGQLVPFDIALGAIYMSVAVIEFFGIWAAIRQSLPMVRLYATLSLVTVAIVFGAEILRLVVHFKFKQSMINQCISVVSSNDNGSDDAFGFFGSHSAHGLDPADANDFCNDAWSHNTFSDIAWLILSLICSLVFSSIAYSYYRQLLDPTSVAGRYTRRQPDNVPLDTFRNHGELDQYAPGLPYNASGPSSVPAPEYAPPYEPSKLPGYGGYSENVEPDKKRSDEEKDLAGVSY